MYNMYYNLMKHKSTVVIIRERQKHSCTTKQCINMVYIPAHIRTEY